MLVNPIGPTCHKGTSSCFGQASHQWLFLYQLEQLLAERKSADPESSAHGEAVRERHQAYCAQKVGEEGVETALAATVHDREELTVERWIDVSPAGAASGLGAGFDDSN
ncbi:hypothetical protein ACNKHS_12320 [Shigella flexneri]